MRGSHRPARRCAGPGRSASTQLAAAIVLAALAVVGSQTRGDEAQPGSAGLLARTRQSLAGDGAAPVAEHLDRQDPARSNLAAPRAARPWWQLWNKPARRSALDFWSQDSTTR